MSMMGQKDSKLSNCLYIFGKPVALAGQAFFGLIALNLASVISLFFDLRMIVDYLTELLLGHYQVV